MLVGVVLLGALGASTLGGPKDDEEAAAAMERGDYADAEAIYARMVEEDRYCIDVLTQISAVQAALDKVALGLMDQHAHHCIIDKDSGQAHERTEELMAAVGRLMRRG